MTYILQIAGHTAHKSSTRRSSDCAKIGKLIKITYNNIYSPVYMYTMSL